MDRRRFVATTTAAAFAAIAWIRGGPLGAHAALPARSSSADDIARGLVRAILAIDAPRFPRIDPETVRQRMYAMFSLEADAQFAGALTLFDGGRFTQLDLDAQRAYLRAWSQSERPVQRQFYRSIKTLVVAAAYSMDAMWHVIGYEGPLLARSASR
jgi:hypothetical protein